MKRTSVSSLLRLLVVFPLAGASFANAQSTWTGSTGDWSTPSNWDVVPTSGSGTILVFNPNSTYTSTNDLGTFSLSQITVGDSVGSHTATISGGTLNFVAPGSGYANINYASGSSNVRLNIDSAVSLNGRLLLTGSNRNGGVTFNGLVSGTGHIYRSSSLNRGQTTLTHANNTFSGGIFIGGGEVVLQASGAGGTGIIQVGTAATGAKLTFNGAANQTHTNAIRLGVTGSASNTPTISNEVSGLVLDGDITGTTTQGDGTNFRLYGTAGSTATVNGIIGNTAGTLNLLKEGDGAWTLAANNTYDGSTAVNAGLLATDSLGGTFGTGNVNVAAGAVLVLGNSASIADAAILYITGNSGVVLGFSGVEILTGIILGTDETGSRISDGIYNATELNSFFGSSIFSGSGTVNVGGIVPEPSSFAVLAAAIIFSGVVVCKRRRR